MMSKHIAKYVVNAKPYEVLIDTRMTLTDVLRDEIGLIGTKLSCGAGSCGACTVLVDGKAIRSCLTLAITAKNKSILTVEGLAEGSALHPIQRAFIENGSIQCGFCTSGQIMSAKALLDKNPNPTRQEVKEALAGNLCRCTGYVKIVEGVMAAAEELRQGGNSHG